MTANRRGVGPDFHALFEASPGRFLVLDGDLMIVAVSDAYLVATMTDRTAIVGRHLFDVFPNNPSDPAASGVDNLRASLDQVLAARVVDRMVVQRYDIRRRESDGGAFEERFWSLVNSPVLDAEGSLRYIIHRVEDVTEFVRLKQLEAALGGEETAPGDAGTDVESELFRRAHEVAEANRKLTKAVTELRRSEQFLESVIENIPDAVFVKDAADLRFVRFNRAGEDLHGRPSRELIGRNVADLVPPEQAAFFTLTDREAIDGRQVIDIPEEPIDTPNLGRRILHTKKIPIFDEAGRPAYLLGISEDITARKQAEDELRAARGEADRANRAKTDFVAHMSHELRTPLTAILGFAQLLELDELTEDHRSSVTHILQAGHHLLDLINEILDISRMERGQLTISPEPVAVDELLDEVTAVMIPLAAEREISLARSKGTGVHVVADRQRLRQVILNLLSNAMKYNRDGGSVTIGCDRVAGDRLQIAIADTGYGIAPGHLDRLFQPFDRLGAQFGAIEGTGIGLALAKGLVEAMGGTIGVTSQLDVGTTFTIELTVTEGPVERYERTAPSGDTPVGEWPRRTVLQIEDNVSNVRLVERILQRRPDIDLLTAGKGEEGIELARSRSPHLILLDLHLTGLPGDEVLEQLRGHPETREIPIIIVSADATPGQVDRMQAVGVFAYLTKPLDVADFLRTVDRAVYGGDSATPT